MVRLPDGYCVAMSRVFRNLDLPIKQVLPELITALNTGDELVLEAPPGAGKTTCVPLALLGQTWLGEQKILLLEPRRLAARAAAERMAQLLGEKVGETVGYRVRLDSKVGPRTKIEVVTEGILTRMLQSDPSLEGVGLVIFDEFHERSLDGDLGLALALQSRELFADLRESPLKLLLMSATLDGASLSELLAGAPVLSSQGRMFPVKTIYGTPYQYGERIAERVTTTVRHALAEQSGSLLVFLPGQGEIRQVQQRLNAWLSDQPDGDNIYLTPLFGDLSLADQRRAIEPCVEGQRKIVLATNIAETSLTIDGVSVVIDSGLCRQASFDPSTGMARLGTQRVSKASATQRAGRAGRLEPGVCYRLWSETQQDELAAFSPAEIKQADLAPLALQLLQWGVSDPAELAWLDAPAAAPYQQALTLLQQLGAVTHRDERWSLTAHGETMARLPTHPRLAHMILMAQSAGLAQQACELAALLGERDLLFNAGADLHQRLDLLRGVRRAERTQVGAIARIKQLKKQFSRLLPSSVANIKVTQVSDPQAHKWTGLLLAWAYPDRIAGQRSRGSADYLLSNGRAAALREHDALSKHRWLAIGQLGGQKGGRQDHIYLAAAIDESLFEHYLLDSISRETVVAWDEQSEKLIAERRSNIGRLTIAKQRLPDISAEQRATALLGLVRKRGLGLLSWPAETQQWRARIQLLRALDGEALDDSQRTGNSIGSRWPDLSDTGLLNHLEEWLLPYLDKVTKLSHFKQLDTQDMLNTLLPWPLPSELNEQAPLRIRVPSGSNITVDYSQNPPVLAVKLQEMFGCEHTPRIALGRLKLLVHLLSPAQRPLQVTQDLAGFWRGSYHDVKKEMKGRYPKHPWPDNPLEAIATGKVKRRSH